MPRGDIVRYVYDTSFSNLSPGTGGRFLLELLQLSPGWLQTLLHLQLFDDTLVIKYNLRLMPATLEMGKRCPGRWSTSLCSQGLAEGFMVIPFTRDGHR